MDERPRTLHAWRIDEPGSERYDVCILSDRTLFSAVGRYAQGSGSVTVSWDEFLKGEMQDLVRETMGEEIFTEVLERVRELAADD